MFAAMLKGEITMPPPPRHAVRPVSADRHLKKTWGAGVHSQAMAAHQQARKTEADENRQAILEMVLAGVSDREVMMKKTELCLSTVHKRLTELADMDLIEKANPGRCCRYWKPKGTHLPHQYSTGPCHSDALEEVSKEASGKTVFFGGAL